MILAHHEMLLAVEAAMVSGLSLRALAGLARRRGRFPRSSRSSNARWRDGSRS